LIFDISKNVLKTLSFAAIAFQGSYFVLDGMLTAFELSRMIHYAERLQSSLITVENSLKRMTGAVTNAERLFKEIDEKPIVDAEGGKLVLDNGIKSSIVFKNVSFAYSTKQDVSILKKINLNIKQGQHLAIVGESGSGKSTIISLIQRLYDPTQGQILIDGHDLKEFDLKWLHSRMGVISQEPGLFSGTFEDNITYGVSMYSDDDVENAMNSAYMKRFVNDKEQFPNGLQTNVGERGNKLSGGQKQRVAIARALIKKPDILILDEATSALDVESEHQIMKGMELLLKDKTKTVIVIAHRLSTIMHCDKIVVCQNGEIVEEGDHSELVQKEGGLYKNLVDRQHFSSQDKQ
jgi:ABC-type multidrug transport system fused ATPase/permease subunit